MRDGRWLYARSEHVEVRFNCNKGLAIDEYIDKRISLLPLFGTLGHGKFDHIGWGADYYSGHMIYQMPGSHQITDLEKIEPNYFS